jgi:hypothetical protein
MAVKKTQAATALSLWIRRRDELTQALAVKSGESIGYGMCRTAFLVLLKLVAEADF